MNNPIRKQELIATIAGQTGVSKKQASTIVNAILNQITMRLQSGKRIKLAGFGSFHVVETKKKTIRHPTTFKEITIPARNSPKFKPAEKLKQLVITQHQDGRNLDRREFIFELPVFDQSENRLIGELGDITPKGLLIHSKTAGKKNQIYRFKIVFPQKIVDQQEWIFRAKCIWRRKTDYDEYYHIGYRIMGITKLDRKIIEELLEEYTVKR